MVQLTNNTGTDLLFSQYVEVVNRAISENRDGFYGKVIKLWEKAIGDEMIVVSVYKTDPDNPHAVYTIRLRGGRFEILSNNRDPAAKFKLKIKESYLQKVVDNPDYYVEHPLKLDLDWLKTRIGLC